MRKHVFAAAGMNSTRIEDRLEIVKNHISEYALIDGRLAHDRRLWQHELPSFYGLWTTLGDMVKWDRALDEGLLLKPETLQSMWLPAHLKNGNLAIVDGYPYGLGWFVPTIAGHRIVGHPGYFGSVVFKFPDDGLTVIFFANLATTAGSYQVTMAAQIAALTRPNLAPLLAPLLGSPPSKDNQPK
jgi:CubicO group peptidase (beta-lactamase class C family)